MWFLILGVISGIFWLIEARPLISCAMKTKTPRKGFLVGFKDRMDNAGEIIAAVFKSWPAVVDVTITIWLINMLGLGMSTNGAIIGLGISNIIGAVLAFISLTKKGEEYNE